MELMARSDPKVPPAPPAQLVPPVQMARTELMARSARKVQWDP